MRSNNLIAAYYQLTKPGIIYGNAITAAAGFLLASKGHVDAGLLLAVLLGTCLVIASACVLNNFIDRDIDKHMSRTRQRALVSGQISVTSALVYAAVLGLIGFAVLICYTSWLVVVIGAVGLIDYVVLYSIWKRRSPVGTVIGSISGATPIVAGYCAAAGQFDLGAIILLTALITWQMPHFYAIALYRFKDYKAAALPVLPLIKGTRRTKIVILVYIAAFIATAASLTIFGYAGYTYLVVMTVAGLWWLKTAARGLRADDDGQWARQLFGFSLIIILVFSSLLALEALLP